MKITESERHAVAHARYRCEQASPDNPEVCFDYELVQSMVSLIDRLKEAVEMADNRLECSLLDEGVCRHCVELARSYL